MMKLNAMATRKRVKDYFDVVEMDRQRDITEAIISVQYFYDKQSQDKIMHTLKNPTFNVSNKDNTVDIKKLLNDISDISKRLP